MRVLWPRLALAAALVLSLTACGSGSRPNVASSPAPGEPQAVTLQVGGLERAYYVLFPANRNGRLPLVLALHGYTQSVGGLEYGTGLNDEASAADPTTSNTDITETRTWAQCRDGSSVVSVIVKGGGHTFWLDRLPAQLNVNEYIWKFFKNVPTRT